MEIDENGVQYLPLPPGFKYGEESLKPKENFRDDGSYRLDFPGVHNMCNIGGFLQVSGPASEEFAGKLLGTHSSNSKNSGSYVIGITLDGARVRLRKEIHPHYTNTLEKVKPNLGDLRKRWVGLQYFKLNVGTTVQCQAYIDLSGFGVDSKPHNSWAQIYNVVDDGKLASSPYKKVWQTPSIKGKGQNTLRVDEQNKDSFKYKFVFCREIVAI